MSEENSAPDLFDLKFMPSWVKEAPNENRYADFAGDEDFSPGPGDRRDRGRERNRDRRGGERRDRGSRPPRGKDREREPRGRKHDQKRTSPGGRPPESRQAEVPATPPPQVDIRFVPDQRVLENVLAQIKASHIAYSVFSLARMFLDKPERYDVRLKAENGTLSQLGEHGAVAGDRRVLENGAFVGAKDEFYRTDVVQSEPIKGNFTSVARDRLSGTLLGPTNHHAYQAKLRGLYEQRYSRRMSFQDFQRQIEIVSDPETVERWKEEARSLTTYTTQKEETPATFQSASDAERHFRQNYLPGMIRESAELTVDGVVSRRLPDRSLGRTIENAWSQEFRSPTRMMQELIGAFRQNALHIFRHRKGMLFVSPVRARPFNQATSSLSGAVTAILSVLTENPGLNRKQLLEKLPHEETADAEAIEKRKRALVSDLHWLVHEGHVIEFNDGTLDLPRAKAPASSSSQQPAPTEPVNGSAPAEALPNEAAQPEESNQLGEVATPKPEIPAEGSATAESTAAVEAETSLNVAEIPATESVVETAKPEQPVTLAGENESISSTLPETGEGEEKPEVS